MKRRCLALALLLCAAAPAPPMLQAIRQRDWNRADRLAAREPDRLAAKLVTFLRLIAPGQASPDEIDAFLAANRDWPDRALLLHRRDEALIAAADLAQILASCRAYMPVLAEALTRCADAAATAGQPQQAQGFARTAWPGLPAQEAPAFLARWSAALRPSDEWARFDRLAWSGDPEAAQAATRLDAPHRLAASARLAFRQDAPDAPARLASVPPELQNDPGLVLEQARYLRRTGQMDAAAALWPGVGEAAERAASSAHAPAFWNERDQLARALLDAGRIAAARQIADDAAATGEARADAQFLSGWLALQFANDAPDAVRRFRDMATGAHSVLTLSRAFYWLGRAQEAAANRAAARAAYVQAAASPVTFYGQRAASELGQTIRLPPDPPASSTATIAFAAREPVRAAVLLAAWGDPKRARDFLIYAAQTSASAPDFALAAAEAHALELTDMAVQIARLAGRAGFMLPQAGWPMPVHPPASQPPAPLVLGLVRQESSFDPAIVSHAGAIGLMQLRPATAADLARADRASPPNLTDPNTNLRLGSEYLAELLGEFDGNIPLALAAYDAGPHRAATWRDAHGEPAGIRATIDWIERIPFAETRGYVQRVIENSGVYAVKLDSRFDAMKE